MEVLWDGEDQAIVKQGVFTVTPVTTQPESTIRLLL